MIQTVLLPQGTYPGGTRNFGPLAIAQGVQIMRLGFSAAQLTDPALTLLLSLDFRWSNAAQEPWASDGGGGYDPFPYPPITLHGGTYNKATGLWEVGTPTFWKTGLPIPELFISIETPRPELPTRQLRGTFVQSIAMTTQVVLTTLP